MAKRNCDEQIQFRLRKLATKFADWNYVDRDDGTRTEEKLNGAVIDQVIKLLKDVPGLGKVYRDRMNHLDRKLRKKHNGG